MIGTAGRLRSPRLGQPGATFLVVLALCAVAVAQSPKRQRSIREVLVEQLAFTEAQADAVRDGDVVTVDVPGSVAHETAVAGAVRINAPASRLVALFRDIERLEQGGGFLATRKMSNPPVLADLADFQLPEQDVVSLASCRPGSCDVKLGQEGFDRLARLDLNAPDAPERARQLAREMAFDYVEKYRTGGNAALAVYLDAPRPIDIAKEFADMVSRSSLTLLPEVSSYLLQYPRARPASVEDFYYWSLAEFGLKPVFRINHVVIHHPKATGGLRYVVTAKQLYASHYFHTALEVRVLFDDPQRPGKAHYLVVLNLARSDGMEGLIGKMVRSKARSGARSGLFAALGTLKKRAEAR